MPTLIDSLSGLNVVRVACGKAHTLFLTGMLSTYLLVLTVRTCGLGLVAVAAVTCVSIRAVPVLFLGNLPEPDFAGFVKQIRPVPEPDVTI